MLATRRLALGLDYGSDSARALLVDVATGAEVAQAVVPYPRWSTGRYCDPATQQFRQHPQDYLDVLVSAVGAVLKKAGKGAGEQVLGIGIDTTGSTPIAVDSDGTALAMKPAFAENPNAMFVLWKDHTAVAEAEEINALAHGGKHRDYTATCGGIYSSEWYWAKALHVTRADRAVAKAAVSWVEHCDWLPGVLTGNAHPATMVRSRCAAGHKAMWAAEWGGLPDAAFLAALDPRLAATRTHYASTTHTVDHAVGGLLPQWARKLGLRPGIAVAAGAFDCHLGAVGAGTSAFVLTKVMGTSTCDMIVAPLDSVRGTVAGICGQVDGSIMPGMLGLEAGQSAFGDVYAWYRRLLAWPLTRAGKAGEKLAAELLPALENAAAALPPAGDVVAVDWFNGRRTPDADQRLRGAIAGMHLGSDAPAVYRALIEATAYGSKAIMDRLIREGVPVKAVIAIGGIAQKSPLVMQICADVFQRSIGVVASDQCCALGSAIAAAVAANAYPSVSTAQKRMASRIAATYTPNKKLAKAYAAGYARYQRLGQAMVADARRQGTESH